MRSDTNTGSPEETKADKLARLKRNKVKAENRMGDELQKVGAKTRPSTITTEPTKTTGTTKIGFPFGLDMSRLQNIEIIEETTEGARKLNYAQEAEEIVSQINKAKKQQPYSSKIFSQDSAHSSKTTTISGDSDLSKTPPAHELDIANIRNNLAELKKTIGFSAPAPVARGLKALHFPQRKAPSKIAGEVTHPINSLINKITDKLILIEEKLKKADDKYIDNAKVVIANIDKSVKEISDEFNSLKQSVDDLKNPTPSIVVKSGIGKTSSVQDLTHHKDAPNHSSNARNANSGVRSSHPKSLKTMVENLSKKLDGIISNGDFSASYIKSLTNTTPASDVTDSKHFKLTKTRVTTQAAK